MKILKVTPSRTPNSPMLAEIEFLLEKPIHLICNLVRTKEGKHFISLPSRKYQNKSGENVYIKLAFFNEDIARQVNHEMLKCYEAFMEKQAPNLPLDEDEETPF
jgi:hypothetical protein